MERKFWSWPGTWWSTWWWWDTLKDVVVFGKTLVGEVPLVGMEDFSILWHIMSVGCMAIWRVTVPIRLLNHKLMVVAPLRAIQDPGNQAQEEDEAEDAKFALGA